MRQPLFVELHRCYFVLAFNFIFDIIKFCFAANDIKQVIFFEFDWHQNWHTFASMSDTKIQRSPNKVGRFWKNDANDYANIIITHTHKHLHAHVLLIMGWIINDTNTYHFIYPQLNRIVSKLSWWLMVFSCRLYEIKMKWTKYASLSKSKVKRWNKKRKQIQVKLYEYVHLY